MNRALSAAILIALALSGAAGTASAGDLLYMFKLSYHRNMCWPKPFTYPDRASAMAPFNVMTHNGWRRQNLLGGHHFEPGEGKLNMAGQLKVRWILTQAPVHRRSIYVVRSLDSKQTSDRIEAVQLYAGKVLPIDERADVRDTHLLAEGRSAAIVDAINVRFAESMPPPVLPAPKGDSFGGG